MSLEEINGLSIEGLNPIEDSRGDLTEIYRQEWNDGDEPIQWNYVNSKPNVLRGFHLHLTHTDYLILVEGKMKLAVKDLRHDSKTFGLGGVIELDSTKKQVVTIQPGIGHAFYFPVKSSLIYGLTHYWYLPDELGCMWNDPNLSFQWEISQDPILLSDRDANAGNFADMMTRFNEKWTSGKSN